MKLIESRTLSSASDSIVFSNIPQNFTDIMMVCSTRERDTSTYTSTLSVNGSTASMDVVLLQGSGTGVVATSSTTIHILSTPSNAIANTFASTQIYFSNYSGSTNKSFSIDTVTATNATESYQRISNVLRSNTEAITGLTISGGLDAGSTITLYGIGGVGDGYAAPKATGGIVSYAGGYTIHTFTSSGTFTPNTNLTDVEYLVVAGGGGGGWIAAGGGGAGGLRSTLDNTGGGGSLESKLSLTSGTAYTVTVGAGGATVSSSNGANGSNSVFSTITSTGGGGGGNNATIANNGGSGGGGANRNGGSPQPAAGTGTVNQGFAGGLGNNGTAPTFGAGGGGGGAGAIGSAATSGNSNIAGIGGDGVLVSITGSSTAYAGGGGGSSRGTGGAGGTGGGGKGADGSAVGNANAVAGTASRGSGGGGGFTTEGGNAANGGSGIVIVRYAS